MRPSILPFFFRAKEEELQAMGLNRAEVRAVSQFLDEEAGFFVPRRAQGRLDEFDE